MAYSPILSAQFSHAIQVCNDIHAVRFGTGVILLGYPNYRFHHIWETAATAAALLHRMIDLRRDDQLPTVLVEQRDDRLLDFLLGDDITLADQHFRLSGWRRMRPSG
jgi:hypothetical protein